MRIVFQLLGMVFYPLIVHLLIKLDVPWLAVAGLMVTSLVYLFLVLGLHRDTGVHRGWLALYVFFAVLGTVNLLTDTHYALFFPPLLINLAIASVFGATLRPGSTPLVELMMRFEYEGQPPPAALKGFARNLTWTWTLYLAGAALSSVVLALTARLEVWSLFTNILNYVFAVILLFAQYLYRFLRYRQYGVFMPWDTLRGMARLPWPGRAPPGPVGNGQAPK